MDYSHLLTRNQSRGQAAGVSLAKTMDSRGYTIDIAKL